MKRSDEKRWRALSNSKFRSCFKLDEKDHANIGRTGIVKIEEHAHDFIRHRLAPAHPQNDGKQTLFRGHPVFKAQHGTAACCRGCPSATLKRKFDLNKSTRTVINNIEFLFEVDGCLQKWYRIKKDRELSESEIKMVVEIVLTWIKNQLKENVSFVNQLEVLK